MLVEQLSDTLEVFNLASERLVGTAGREVFGFVLFYGAIFLAALPIWRFAVGVEGKKAAVLASCCMSSVHGILSALGETFCSIRCSACPYGGSTCSDEAAEPCFVQVVMKSL